MPALLAYLFSIAIFIGGGYAGLVWLANPPTEGPIQSASSQSKKSGVATKTGRSDTAAGTPKAMVKPSEDEPVGATSSGAHATDRNFALELPAGKVGPEVKPAGSGTAAQEQPVIQQSNVPIAPSDQTHITTENVPAEGCMPIGVTARGKLVFPMQCREVALEHNLEPVRPSGGEPAQRQEGSRASTASPSDETAAEAAQAAKPLGVQGAGMYQAQPSSTPASMDKSKISQESVSRAETKPVPEKTDPAINENKVFDLPKLRQASKAKPVMMILRTIEFPDGHREQRLLPMNRTPKTESQSEESWFSPLSYR